MISFWSLSAGKLLIDKRFNLVTRFNRYQNAKDIGPSVPGDLIKIKVDELRQNAPTKARNYFHVTELPEHSSWYHSMIRLLVIFLIFQIFSSVQKKKKRKNVVTVLHLRPSVYVLGEKLSLFWLSFFIFLIYHVFIEPSKFDLGDWSLVA